MTRRADEVEMDARELLRPILWAALKCAVTVGIVGGVGLAIVSSAEPRSGAGGVVNEAEADIWARSFAPKSGHRRFVETLREQGLEPPREYEWNGNDVYFSTTTTEETPREVMERFQRAMKRNGLIDRVHDGYPDVNPGLLFTDEFEEGSELSTSTQKESARAKRSYFRYVDDMVGGGAVPTRVSEDRMQMSGFSTEGRADSAVELIEEHGRTLIAEGRDRPKKTEENIRGMVRGENLTSIVDAMRYLDARRTASGETRITSTWTAEGAEIANFLKDQDEATGDLVGSESDPVPTCPGCENLIRLSSQDGKKQVVNTFDAGGMEPASARRYYERELQERGWEPASSAKLLERAARQGLAPSRFDDVSLLSRGNQQISIYPVEDEQSGETLVQVMEMP